VCLVELLLYTVQLGVSAFSPLRRLDVTGEAITATAAKALSEMAPGVLDLGYQQIRADDETYFRPPLVGFFDTWVTDRA
jgi:hypothetical protein